MHGKDSFFFFFLPSCLEQEITKMIHPLDRFWSNSTITAWTCTTACSKNVHLQPAATDVARSEGASHGLPAAGTSVAAVARVLNVVSEKFGSTLNRPQNPKLVVETGFSGPDAHL